MIVPTVFKVPCHKHHAACTWHHVRRSSFALAHYRAISISMVSKLPCLLDGRGSGSSAKGKTHFNLTHRVGVGVSSRSCHTRTGSLPELEVLYNGNRKFRDTTVATNSALLKVLAEEGQRPQFMFLDCSDSRVCEQTMFSAKPGTMFTTANIANQYNESDLSANAVLSFAVNVLGVKHVVVMGHYGCGGVATALLPPPSPGITNTNTTDEVQNWIRPIREIYRASTRKEIVEHRDKRKLGGGCEDVNAVPHIRDPAFCALIEENVKANVQRIARSSVITARYAAFDTPKSTNYGDSNTEKTPGEVFVHGWVYDIETGEVMDLGVSVAPPGREVPKMPFKRLSAEKIVNHV